MTCRSCGFNNMKNAAVCARCGAKLVWDGPVRKRDFQPERRAAQSLLGATNSARLHRLLNQFVAACGPLAVFGRIPRKNFLWGLASIVPGAGHFRRGEWQRGLILLGIWAALLLLTLGGIAYRVPVAALIGPALLAMAHCFAAITALRPRDFCRSAAEAQLIALGVTALIFALYFSASYLMFDRLGNL